MRKCKNFLQTLIKLASQSTQPPHTAETVRQLIQMLVVCSKFTLPNVQSIAKFS